MKPRLLTYVFLFAALLWSCTPEDQEQVVLKDTNAFEFTTDFQLEQEEQQLMEQVRLGLHASPHERSSARVIMLPAGSVNGLARAIRAANGGIVYVQSGEHRESGTVTIDRKVTIIAGKDAVLIVNTQSTPPVVPAQPALHILNAPGTYINGLDIRPEGAIGGIGILVQNSPGAKIIKSTILEHQFGIISEKSSASSFYLNTIVTNKAWQTGAVGDAHGIINVNGEDMRIISNDVSNSLFGIWACDKNGLVSSNKVHNNFIGIILCKVPDAALPLPDGTFVGAALSGTNWTVRNNNAINNLDVGYLVIDGANKNLLTNNFASNNARVDYEVVGDSQRFGFFTPEAFDNTIQAKPGQTVKDCGVNSTITGGVRINTQTSPCF